MSIIDGIINRQLMRWELERHRTDEHPTLPPTPPRIITISRQTGSRGSYLATLLAQRLGFQRLHREVIDAISQSSGYYKRLIASLDEHFHSNLEASIEATLTGQWVNHHDYVKHLYRVVHSMAELGGVVLMGRGGNFILGPNRGFHIRVVCPEEARIGNLVAYKQMSLSEAKHRIQQSDKERQEFIAKVYHANIDNPMHYDLVLNSGQMDIDRLVDIAELAFQAKMVRLQATQTTGIHTPTA